MRFPIPNTDEDEHLRSNTLKRHELNRVNVNKHKQCRHPGRHPCNPLLFCLTDWLKLQFGSQGLFQLKTNKKNRIKANTSPLQLWPHEFFHLQWLHPLFCVTAASHSHLHCSHTLLFFPRLLITSFPSHLEQEPHAVCESCLQRAKGGCLVS